MSSEGPRGRKHEETIVKRVARKGHHDDHGGNWKVAFADFCLALLCLFMVLWVLSARDEEATNHKLSLSMAYDGSGGMLDGGDGGRSLVRIAEHTLGTDRPDGERSEQDDTVQLRSMAREVQELAAELKLDSNLQVVMTPMGLRVVLHDTYRRGVFQLGSATPEPVFADLIAQMGALFRGMRHPVLVIGHTDSAPYRDGAGHTNWHLSASRAMAAWQLLMRGGLPEEQLLQVVGMAERTPIDPARPRAAVNRRIEFILLSHERAREIRTMFGAPEYTAPLAEGVRAVRSSDQSPERGI